MNVSFRVASVFVSDLKYYSKRSSELLYCHEMYVTAFSKILNESIGFFRTRSGFSHVVLWKRKGFSEIPEETFVSNKDF